MIPPELLVRLAYIAGALCILSIIGFLLRLYFRNSQKQQEKEIVSSMQHTDSLPQGKIILMETPLPSHDHKALIGFIELNKKHGISTTAIQEKLLRNGWLKEVVDVYLGHET